MNCGIRLSPGTFRISFGPTLAALALLGACNVDAPQSSTGGSRGDTCERFALVRSDYQSTQVSLVNDGGAVTSASIVSSGTRAPGATSALSSDVVLPHDPPASGALVLIDRYPNGIVTWLDAESGAVEGQLNVTPGFGSNPHDYLEITPNKAYVTRFETNRAPGRVPFDEGGDILVIDPSQRSLSKRIELSAYGGAVDPRPDRMTLANGRAYVTLSRLDASFERAEDGLVVVIDVDSDRVVDTLPRGHVQRHLQGPGPRAGRDERRGRHGSRVEDGASAGDGLDAGRSCRVIHRLRDERRAHRRRVRRSRRQADEHRRRHRPRDHAPHRASVVHAR